MGEAGGKKEGIAKAIEASRNDPECPYVRPVCPICEKTLVRVAYQDRDIGWIVIWICDCEPYPEIPIQDDPTIGVYIRDRDLQDIENETRKLLHLPDLDEGLVDAE